MIARRDFLLALGLTPPRYRESQVARAQGFPARVAAG